ncbi:MAG TPA: ankyrin repeat domain-containing protein, partial [Gammaproteobacteria bacterium]|nr:ankyrin repeat domain-containing protein [Gammaproteobacteria bacterium]
MPGEQIDYALDYYGRPSYFSRVYAKKNDELQTMLADVQHRALINTPVRTQGGQTVAHVACYGSADRETVEILYDAGADFSITDNMGRLPFHIAANAGDPAIVALILDRVRASPSASPTTLELLKNKDLASGAVRLLKRKLVSTTDNLDRTALHAVCMSGSSVSEKRRDADLILCLQTMLSVYDEASSKVEALTYRDEFNITPLMYAKHFGYTEILEYAQTLEIDLDEIQAIPLQHPALSVDYFGRNAVMEAAFGKIFANDVDISEEFLQRALQHPNNANDPTTGNMQTGSRNSLHYAVGGGTPAKLRMVLTDSGHGRTNVLAVDVNGSTPLHFAASRGNRLIMTALMEQPKICNNINRTDNFGMTALHALAMTVNTDASIIEQRLDCLQQLIENGVDLFIKNNNGHTALDVARIRVNQPVIDMLSPLMAQELASRQNVVNLAADNQARGTQQQGTSSSNQARVNQQQPTSHDSENGGCLWALRNAMNKAKTT